MKFKDYVLEYLVNKDDLDWDVICELDGFKEDFNANGILSLIVFSLFGTIFIIIIILDEFSDIVILKKKRKNKLK